MPQTKEDYFLMNRYTALLNLCTRFEVYQRTDLLYPQVNRLIMERSWTSLAGTGTQELDSVFSWGGEWGKEKLEQQGIVTKVVLMTGGASRMQFTRQICEFFPNPNLRFALTRSLSAALHWV